MRNFHIFYPVNRQVTNLLSILSHSNYSYLNNNPLVYYSDIIIFLQNCSNHTIFYLYQLQNLMNPYQICSSFISQRQDLNQKHYLYAIILKQEYYLDLFVYCLQMLVIISFLMDLFLFIKNQIHVDLIFIFSMNYLIVVSFVIIVSFYPSVQLYYPINGNLKYHLDGVNCHLKLFLVFFDFFIFQQIVFLKILAIFFIKQQHSYHHLLTQFGNV